jgi:hypothetical protein
VYSYTTKLFPSSPWAPTVKGGKTEPKADKQAAKATSKTDKQHTTKKARAAHKLSIH